MTKRRLRASHVPAKSKRFVKRLALLRGCVGRCRLRTLEQPSTGGDQPPRQLDYEVLAVSPVKLAALPERSDTERTPSSRNCAAVPAGRRAR